MAGNVGCVLITSRWYALAYRIVAVGLIGLGIVRLAGVFTTTSGWKAFLFYTGQSNVVCLVWLLILALVTVRDIAKRGSRGISSPSPRVSAAVMMTITITMLIYLVFLAPQAFQQSGSGYQPFDLTDTLVHVIAPVLTIGDWLLFAPKGAIGRFDPLVWLAAPVLYLGFVVIWTGFGGDFGAGRTVPYPFLDTAAHGWAGVIVWIALVGIALTGVGYGYRAIDRVLARRT